MPSLAALFSTKQLDFLQSNALRLTSQTQLTRLSSTTLDSAFLAILSTPSEWLLQLHAYGLRLPVGRKWSVHDSPYQLEGRSRKQLHVWRFWERVHMARAW
mmetsp:Transcript_4623/g.16567  ORF Transcript_4623/g.16567 Transcript_4623/m.16567 type:complete len:101 (-) Transcript_4623:64-366(-)